MSGGVDSTVAASYLKESGYEVTGVSLIMSDFSDTASAKKAAAEVGIPFVELDVRNDFEKYVVADFIHNYSCGRTPNPCTVCNPNVKFAALCRYAEENAYDVVSTGHYCRVKYDDVDGRYFISRAGDLKKDQSYMLWGLSQKQLSMLTFPLSDITKVDVRQSASERGFYASSARDSQEICFIPDGHYANFIEERTGKFKEGNFISPDGSVAGRHKGIVNYTIGQRKHLGISLGRPVFVSKIDTASNEIYLSYAGDNFFSSMIVTDINFQKLTMSSSCVESMEKSDIDCKTFFFDDINICCDTSSVMLLSGDVYVKVRYAAAPVLCRVYFVETEERYSAYVIFDDPVKAVTPGQSAVFYNGKGDLLFGGVILSGKLK